MQEIIEEKVYNVILDDEGYWTGQFSIVGKLEGSIPMKSIPDEADRLKQRCYKPVDEKWEYYPERYEILSKEVELSKLQLVKNRLFKRVESCAKEYFATTTATSAAHGGVAAQYAIDETSRSLLADEIKMCEVAKTRGREYQPSWNAAGQNCTHDWTYEELLDLSLDLAAVIKPAVNRKIMLMNQIMEATTLEELESIDISFGEEV